MMNSPVMKADSKQHPGMRWQYCPMGAEKEKLHLRELGISPLAARILQNRGISSPEEAKRFLYPTLSDLPDPFTMKGMEKAVRRIVQALRNQEKITLFGDYDVDGTTATSVLLLFLQEFHLAGPVAT